MASIEFQIGESAIRNYKRLSYEIWYALAEFIDNSTQSYFNNREILDAEFAKDNSCLEVVIAYDNKQRTLLIRDNAMGMELSELTEALKMGNPPKNATGRSEFGMGLKTAACWLGDVWTIRTKKLGHDKEYEITFDVESVASGNTNLNLVERNKNLDLHYTIIEIKQMHRAIVGRTIQTTKTFLRSLYRVDTRNGTMLLKWGEDEILDYDAQMEFLVARNGDTFRKDFAFEVNGKKIHGWVGVLASGGRPKGGFALIRRDRVIKGQPSAWRPHEIFGQEDGSNDLINQRLVGEVHLDDFQVSHTKDAILWMENEEQEVGEQLFEHCAIFRKVAQDTRTTKGQLPESAFASGVSQVKIDLSNPSFADAIFLNEVPTPEMIIAENEPIIAATADSEPDIVVRIHDYTINIFHDPSYTSNDPYYVTDYGVHQNIISVAINTKHPFFGKHVTNAESVRLYYLLCCFDAISEWKCLSKTSTIDASTVRSIKNDLMRTHAQISLDS